MSKSKNRCRGTNARGVACNIPFVGPDGYCTAHGKGTYNPFPVAQKKHAIRDADMEPVKLTREELYEAVWTE